MRRTTHFYVLVSTMLLLQKGVLPDSIETCDQILPSNITEMLDIKVNIGDMDLSTDDTQTTLDRMGYHSEDVAMYVEVRRISNKEVRMDHIRVSRRMRTETFVRREDYNTGRRITSVGRFEERTSSIHSQRRYQMQRMRYQPYNTSIGRGGRRNTHRDRRNTERIRATASRREEREVTERRQRDGRRSSLRRDNVYDTRRMRASLQIQRVALEPQHRNVGIESERQVRPESRDTDRKREERDTRETSRNTRRVNERYVRRTSRRSSLTEMAGERIRRSVSTITVTKERQNSALSRTLVTRRDDNLDFSKSSRRRRDGAIRQIGEDDRRIEESRMIDDRHGDNKYKDNSRYESHDNARRQAHRRIYQRRMRDSRNLIATTDETSRRSAKRLDDQSDINLKDLERNNLIGRRDQRKRMDVRVKDEYRVLFPDTAMHRVMSDKINGDIRRTNRRDARERQGDAEAVRHASRDADVNRRRTDKREIIPSMLKQFGLFNKKTESFMCAGSLVHAITLGFAVFLGKEIWQNQI